MNATEDHYRKVANLQVKAAAIGRHQWGKTNPDYISQSWGLNLPTLVNAISVLQYDAAAEGASYGAAALAGQGDYEAPTGFVNPYGFVGIASDGRSLEGLLQSPVITAKTAIGNGASAGQALQMGRRQLDMLLLTLIADVARSAASVDITARPGVGYVRMVSPGACARCAILAGRFYRWNTGFLRHPNCGCVHIPARQSRKAAAIKEGYIADPYAYFRSLPLVEQNRLLSKAGAQSVRDGADIFQVVNSRRGRTKTGMFTTEGMSTRGHAAGILKRGQRRATPELIYKWAKGDRGQAQRLLREHGYILPGGQNPVGVLRGAREGFGQYGKGGRAKASTQAVLEARQRGWRDPNNVYTMTAAERRLYVAERDYKEVLVGRNPWTTAAVERRGGAKIGGTDEPLTAQIAASVESTYRAELMAAMRPGGILSKEVARRPDQYLPTTRLGRKTVGKKSPTPAASGRGGAKPPSGPKRVSSSADMPRWRREAEIHTSDVEPMPRSEYEEIARRLNPATEENMKVSLYGSSRGKGGHLDEDAGVGKTHYPSEWTVEDALDAINYTQNYPEWITENSSGEGMYDLRAEYKGVLMEVTINIKRKGRRQRPHAFPVTGDGVYMVTTKKSIIKPWNGPVDWEGFRRVE